MVMSSKKVKKESPMPQPDQKGITRITVSNFKSIVGEQSIDIKPLTILAGANSSGKSSIMQPLLLLKQTLEAPYDPGALLLDGPNVNFSQAEQLLARGLDGYVADTFFIGIMQNEDSRVTTFLRKGEGGTFEVEKTIHKALGSEYCIRSNMLPEELNQEIFSFINQLTSISIGMVKATNTSRLANYQKSQYLRNIADILIKTLSSVNETLEEMRGNNTLPFLSSQNRCFLDYSFGSRSAGNVAEKFSLQQMILWANYTEHFIFRVSVAIHNEHIP